MYSAVKRILEVIMTQRDGIYLLKFENYLQPKAQLQTQRFRNIYTKNTVKRNAKSEEIQMPKNNFENYCQIASIHGFANFLNANIWQRIFWWFIIITAITVTLYFFMLDVADKNSRCSAYNLASVEAPIGTTSFPTVSICSLNRISQHKANSLAAKLLGNSTEISQKELVSLFRLALSYAIPMPEVPEEKYNQLQKILDMNNMTLELLLKIISPRCSEFFVYCMWRGRRILCRKVFDEVYTMEGLCCRADISKMSMALAPRHEQAICMQNLGWQFMLFSNNSDCAALVYPNADFLVRVHNPKDVHSLFENGHFIRAGQTQNILVELNSKVTESNFRKISIYERHCVYDKEGYMRWYTDAYTRRKCEIDRWISAWYQRCNCVLPFYPRPKNVRVCRLDAKDRKCFFDPVFAAISENTDVGYNCLPSCEFVSIGQTSFCAVDIDREHSYVEDYDLTETVISNFSINNNAVVNIYYKSLIMYQTYLTQYKTRTALLASMGGVVGLQLGFSVISINEILFFLIIFPLVIWLQATYTKIKKRWIIKRKVNCK